MEIVHLTCLSYALPHGSLAAKVCRTALLFSEVHVFITLQQRL